jgi:hypothetical protein
MAKFQLARMQRKPPRGIGSRAIFAVADDRIPERGQLNADLVLASGFKRQLNQRFVPACANYTVMRDCQLATSIDAAHLHGWVDYSKNTPATTEEARSTQLTQAMGLYDRRTLSIRFESIRSFFC